MWICIRLTSRPKSYRVVLAGAVAELTSSSPNLHIIRSTSSLIMCSDEPSAPCHLYHASRTCTQSIFLSVLRVLCIVDEKSRYSCTILDASKHNSKRSSHLRSCVRDIRVDILLVLTSTKTRAIWRCLRTRSGRSRRYSSSSSVNGDILIPLACTLSILP